MRRLRERTDAVANSAIDTGLGCGGAKDVARDSAVTTLIRDDEEFSEAKFLARIEIPLLRRRVLHDAGAGADLHGEEKTGGTMPCSTLAIEFIQF